MVQQESINANFTCVFSQMEALVTQSRWCKDCIWKCCQNL